MPYGCTYLLLLKFIGAKEVNCAFALSHIEQLRLHTFFTFGLLAFLELNAPCSLCKPSFIRS